MKKLGLILLSFIMVLSLCACASIESQAEGAVKDMLDAFKALDFETMGKYMDLGDMELSEDEGVNSEQGKILLGALVDDLDYKIISSEKSDEANVVVKTEITAINMAAVIKDYTSSALEYALSYVFSSDEPTDEEKEAKNQEFFLAAIEKNKADKKVTEVDVHMTKYEDGWRCDGGEVLADALLGGLKGAVEDFENSLSNAFN